jgi:hypothetical protein
MLGSSPQAAQEEGLFLVYASFCDTERYRLPLYKVIVIHFHFLKCCFLVCKIFSSVAFFNFIVILSLQ